MLIAVVLAVLFRLLPSATPAKTIVAGRASEPIPANPPIVVIPPVTKSTPEPRTYLVFDGMIRFFERKDPTGQLAPDQNLQIGDNFGFNYYFKAVGPNPVTIIHTSRWLYVEGDFKESTQQQIIRDFKTRLGREQRLHQVIPAHYSLMAADGDRFNTVCAVSRAADRKYYDRTVTQDDLDGILAGTEIPFALIEVSYADVGKLHHLRTSQFLQPPGQAPGIWHICDFTFDSD